MTRIRPRWIHLSAIAAASTIALAGCSGATSGVTTSADPSTPINDAVISLPAPNQSFDPTVTVSATDRVVDQLINAHLVQLKFDGTVGPGLAEKYEFNADSTTFTAHLRAGAKFSDGSPVTASDVAATIDRHKAVPESTIASTLDRISSVKAVDPATVQFAFKTPYPSFETDLSTVGIVPAAQLKTADAYYAKPLVSAGQYTLVSGWAGNKLELTANKNYWGPQPRVTNLTVTVIEDANSAISQLQSGQVDFAADLPPNYINQIASTPGIKVITSDVFGFFDLRLHNRSGPFADVNMRKAVNAAIDRKAIVNAIWGTNNKPLSGFWPQSMDGYDNSKSTERDLAAAKGYLAKTACASGCTVRMMYSEQDFAFSGQLALMVQSQLAEIGVTVTLEKLDGATIIDRLFAGNYDISPGAMPSNGNIPDPLLARALLGTGSLKAEFTGYNSDAMNSLIQQVNVSSGADRKKYLTQIETQFGEDQPFVTLAPWVRGSATTLPEGVFSLVGAYAKMSGLGE